uniref:3-hydroxyisobutyrate dehydrogenase n=1 Tax=Syphacia muris TaxID=451379 RepID=A0A0N5AS66_9BILA
MSKVGFIGLGNLGFSMARSLMKLGSKLTVYDSNPSALINIKKLGATIAETPAELASSCTEIVTLLPTEDEIENVFTGHDGILTTIKPKTLCIDCSTVSYNFAKKLSEKVAEKVASFVDSPVSGNVEAAQHGNLAFTIGGDSESYDRARAVLVRLGRKIVHCGPIGTGQIAKLCNNLLFAAEMIGLSEILILGEKFDIPPDMMTSAINTNTAKCFASESYNPIPGINRDAPSSKGYTSDLKCGLIAKVFSMEMNSSLAIGTLTSQIYQAVGNSEFKDQDLSAVIKFLRNNGPDKRKASH